MPATQAAVEQSFDAFSSDILEGTAAIAEFTGKTVRQTQWLLESRQLPAFKIGKAWHMRRSTFRRHIENLETAALLNPTNQ